MEFRSNLSLEKVLIFIFLFKINNFLLISNKNPKNNLKQLIVKKMYKLIQIATIWVKELVLFVMILKNTEILIAYL